MLEFDGPWRLHPDFFQYKACGKDVGFGRRRSREIAKDFFKKRHKAAQIM